MKIHEGIAIVVVFVGALGCSSCGSQAAQEAHPQEPTEPTTTQSPAATSHAADGPTQRLPEPEAGQEIAIFAGGCFWCMEQPFEVLDGVSAVLSGYTGGAEESPSYEQVSRGRTGHTEAVAVLFDPNAVSYQDLVNVFWRNIDPTAVDRQFVDVGRQYRTGIFVRSDAQRTVAEQSKQALVESGRFSDPIVTPVEDAGAFWIAEAYHQDFYRTNPAHYQRYRRGSGRDEFIERHWGDAPSH